MFAALLPLLLADPVRWARQFRWASKGGTTFWSSHFLCSAFTFEPFTSKLNNDAWMPFTLESGGPTENSSILPGPVGEYPMGKTSFGVGCGVSARSRRLVVFIDSSDHISLRRLGRQLRT